MKVATPMLLLGYAYVRFRLPITFDLSVLSNISLVNIIVSVHPNWDKFITDEGLESRAQLWYYLRGQIIGRQDYMHKKMPL